MILRLRLVGRMRDDDDDVAYLVKKGYPENGDEYFKLQALTADGVEDDSPRWVDVVIDYSQ